MMPALLMSTSTRAEALDGHRDGALGLVARADVGRRGEDLRERLLLLDVVDRAAQLLLVTGDERQPGAFVGRVARAITSPSPRDPPVMTTDLPAKSYGSRRLHICAARTTPAPRAVTASIRFWCSVMAMPGLLAMWVPALPMHFRRLFVTISRSCCRLDERILLTIRPCSPSSIASLAAFPTVLTALTAG